MPDPTLDQVRRQLVAMGGDTYDIGIKSQTTGHLFQRIWRRDQLPNVVGFLKHKNANGHHIYVRVHPPPGRAASVILLDDLEHSSVHALGDHGLEPCVVVETSSGNFQAWVRFPWSSLSCTRATSLARLLAIRFGADPCSAAWLHYGRLAGFTNRKPKYRMNRGYPFVRLQLARPVLASRARYWMNQVDAEKTPPCGTSRDLVGAHAQLPTYASLAANLILNGPADQSRIDFAVARYLAGRGYSDLEIRQVLYQSPDLHRRHPRVDHYLDRTLGQVLARVGSRAACAGK